MRAIFGRLAGAFLALALTSGLAAAQSKITVAVDTIFELFQARRAQSYQEAGHPRGKIVLQIAE